MRPRPLLATLLLVLAVLAAPGCVSSRLAEANLESVTALAQAAVAKDEANLPLGRKAVDDAGELLAASGAVSQIVSLGVPTELTDANQRNVEDLAAAVLPTEDQGVRLTVDRAVENAGELSGKAHLGADLEAAARKTPIVDQILGAWEAIASGLVGIYAATRGRKHLTSWWNTPPAPPPAAPPATPTA